jgi:hypothetical protein
MIAMELSSRVLNARPRKSGEAALGRCGRMSRQRKRDTVLCLLRGEGLKMVSRSLGVMTVTLSAWREAFLAAGEASLSTRPMDGETLQSERLKAHAFSEMLLERGLLEAKIALLEARDPSPLARARRRRGGAPCSGWHRSSTTPCPARR